MAMKRIVVKIGGAVLEEPLGALFEGLAALQNTSEVVLVHGGGPQTTEMATRLGHAPTIVEGRRVTTDLDLDILLWMIRGQLNVQLVAEAGTHGIRSMGLSGADGGLVRVAKRPPWIVKGETIDFGHVGDVEFVDPTPILALLQAGIMPVVCPPGVDSAGKLYNVNADTIALQLFRAIQADELLLVTETGSVWDRDKNPIRRLDASMAKLGVEEGWIVGGMKVKTDIGFEALSSATASGSGIGAVLTGAESQTAGPASKTPSVWILGPESVATKKRGTQLIRSAHVGT